MKDRAFFRNHKWRVPVTDELSADEFSPGESIQIERLRRQFELYPETYQLGINFRRLAFARWLAVHGYIGEGVDECTSAHQHGTHHDGAFGDTR